MANAHRGEVDLTIEGKSYTLRLSNNAQCELETLFDGEPVGAILAKLAKGSRTVIRASLWAALREHQPDMTLMDAGDLIDADAIGAGTALSRAVEAAFPEVTGESKNPRQASRRAGKKS